MNIVQFFVQHTPDRKKDGKPYTVYAEFDNETVQFVSSWKMRENAALNVDYWNREYGHDPERIIRIVLRKI